MTTARILVLALTLSLGFAEESPCATPAAPKPEKKADPFSNPLLLGGTIAGAVAAATAAGVGIGVGVHNKQEQDAAAAAAAKEKKLRARTAAAAAAAPTGISLTATAKSGATTLEVDSVVGLAVGDNIAIGCDAKNAEYGKVKAFSSIILEEPLVNEWATTTCVEKVAADKVPKKGMDWKLMLGLGLVVGGLLICLCALAFMCCGKKAKRAKKSKKAPVAPAAEEEVAFEVAPLLPMLTPTTMYQQAPMTTSYAAPMTTSYAAPTTTAYAYEQAAPVYAAATQQYAAAPQYMAATQQYAAAPQYMATQQYAAAPLMAAAPMVWETAGAQ